jgi:transcriptional regulator with XRE-family HTH domain
VSELVNFIKYQMDRLGKKPAQVADDGELSRSALSYILNEKKKSGKPVRPEPETIIKIAKGLEIHPAILVAAMGYPVEPIPGIDERLYEIARRLLVAPWVADRLDDFMQLPRSEFDELMTYLDFRRPPPPNADRSTP